MSRTVVVVGAGANGLAAAVSLAREGSSVLVLDAAPAVGGACAGREFCPGYTHDGLHLDAPVRPFVRTAGELARHGLTVRPAPAVVAPGSGPATMGSPLPALARGAVEAFLDQPVPAIGGDAPWLPLIQRAFAARRLGADAMTELLRVGVTSAEDWTTEWETDPRKRAALVLPSLFGAFMGPRSPHSAGLMLVDHALGAEVAQGPGALAAALTAAAAAWRVTVRTSAQVVGLVAEGGAVKGVRLASGEDIPADLVVSALHPRTTILDLLPPGTFSAAVEDEVRHVRTRVTHATVHLAWSTFPAFADGAPPAERYVAAADTRAVERAFDAAKHRRLATTPALDVRVPTVVGAGSAPPGHHVATVRVLGAPGDLAGGWTPDRRRELVDLVLTALSAHQPTVRDVTVGHEVVAAPDVAASLGLPGGHLWHGERALDTSWVGRPGPHLGRHVTPLRGLVLASPGVHPGGLGASGVLAARAALETW